MQKSCKPNQTKPAAKPPVREREKMMNAADELQEEEEEYLDVVLDEDDIIQEITIDEEDLPDADDEDEQEELAECSYKFTGHNNNKGAAKKPIYEVYTVACSPMDPTLVATGGQDEKGFLWNINQLDSHFDLQGHPYHTEGLTCLVISSDSTFALTGSKDGTVHKVNLINGKVVSSLLAHSDSITCIGLAPRKPGIPELAATGSSDGKLIIWDIPHSSDRSTCNHEDGVNCLAWLGESEYVATGCADGRIHIWNSLSGDCVKIFIGHSDQIQSVAVSACGGFLVSVSFDGDARVFDISEYIYVKAAFSHFSTF